MNIEEISAHLAQKWGNKTLADFRDEAAREATGTVYEALREDKGRRLMLIVCLTHSDQIATLERAFEFVDDNGSEDWNTLTLAEVFKRTVFGTGFTFECLRDNSGKRSSVLICSTEPVSIERLDFLFDLPK